MRVNGQTDLNKFLTMSPNNPEFKYYVTEAKWEARRRVDTGGLSWEQYEEYVKAINLKIEGKLVRPTLNAWATYNKLAKDDGMMEYLEERVLIEVLTARETCEHFIKLIQHPNFQYGEKALHEYFVGLIRRMSAAVKENNEEFWDHYKNLKHYSMWGVAKGILRRDYMDQFASAINVVIGNEIKILKQAIVEEFTKPQTSSRMNKFDDRSKYVEEYVGILDKLPEYITTWLTKPVFESINLSRRDVGILDIALTENKISHDLYIRLRSILFSHSNDLINWSKSSDYGPIMYLRECLDGVSELAGMSLFTKREMSEAYIYAQAFYKHYSNESLVRNILEAMLDNDLHHLGNVVEVNKYQQELYFKSLKLLSDFNIIDLQQNISYEQRGRAKFNAL